MADRAYYRHLSSRFRQRRNVGLSRLIDEIQDIGRVRVLDIGGLPAFWETVTSADKCDITILNSERGAESKLGEQPDLPKNITFVVGDGCAMPQFDDASFDLVVSNSLLEHVGPWDNVVKAASEAARIGRHGWVQTPAFEFPLEVHYMLPFVHWLTEPIRGPILRLAKPQFRHMDKSHLRRMMDYVRLMSRGEFKGLFPSASFQTERFIGLPKSHIATW
jgi:hypothetical protein